MKCCVSDRCFLSASDIIFGHEFKHLINNYLKQNVDHYESELGRNITSLADIIEYNDLNPPNEGYNQSLLKLSEATDGLQNTTYIKARNESREQSTLYLDSIFDEYEVDALATPCHFLYSYGAFAGYPSITVGMNIKTEKRITNSLFRYRSESITQVCHSECVCWVGLIQRQPFLS